MYKHLLKNVNIDSNVRTTLRTRPRRPAKVEACPSTQKPTILKVTLKIHTSSQIKAGTLSSKNTWVTLLKVKYFGLFNQRTKS